MLLYRKYSRFQSKQFIHSNERANEIRQLKELIQTKKPFAVVIAANSMRARDLERDVTGILDDIQVSNPDYRCNVELRDPLVAKVYALSKRAKQELPENYPEEMVLAISLGRYALDPVVETAQLFNTDDDCICLQLSQSQNLIRKERIKARDKKHDNMVVKSFGIWLFLVVFITWTEYSVTTELIPLQDALKPALEEEMQKVIFETGVDVNKCVVYPHMAGTLQFVPGLGPRKADGLIKHFKKTNTRLESLSQLITDQNIQMGPTVWLNCSGFIRIDTAEMGDSTDHYIEVLDGSRIHPENYTYARKMAKDSQGDDHEDDDETENNERETEAIENDLEKPSLLDGLDLESFNADLIQLNIESAQ